MTFDTRLFSFVPIESSSQQYREKKDPCPEGEQEGDSDDHDDSGDDASGGASDYKNPTSDKSRFHLDYIQQFLKQKLGLEDDAEAHTTQTLKTVDFQGLVEHWKEHGFKKIVTMVGAGISTCKKKVRNIPLRSKVADKTELMIIFVEIFSLSAAGIPDFRSPNTGLYHNLQKYDLPYPTAVFEIGFFRKNPKPFFALSKELYPGNFRPTPCHYFVRLLHEKGMLLRHYTQNIDTLEHVAGIPSEKLVEAHGTFHTNHCISCRKEYSMEWAKEQIFADNVPTCTTCKGIVKPDIVFFGEDLPHKFYVLPDKDFKECDLLIIMGTSLEVQPFGGLITRPDKQCVRLLINRELVGTGSSGFDFFFGTGGLRVGKKNNARDVAWLGDCDDGVQALADAVGLGVSHQRFEQLQF